MHRLLKRQLRKSQIALNSNVPKEQMQKFLALVNQAYIDNDDDRRLLEHSLELSSKEMQDLYEELKITSQEKLLKSEARYRHLVENLHKHYFFFAHNREGILTYVSESVTDMLGYSVEEVLKHYQSYLTDDDINLQVEEKTNKALAGQEQAPYIVKVFHKNGTVVSLEITEHPIFDCKGNVVEIEGIARDITHSVKVQQELDYIAQHDILTGIPNRMNLYNQMEHIIATATRQRSKFALLFLDLDHFKNINDTLGHDIGDKLLQQVVAKVKPNIRSEDVFARIGGDEFVIVLSDINKEYLVSLVNKIMNLLCSECVIGRYTLTISSSIGIAIFPDDGIDTISLMKNADIAMYKAKKMGRDHFSFFTAELNREVQAEMSLETDLTTALERNEFVLYFQPQVKTENNQIIGAEALIRWQHPEKGLITPDYFISLAENTGLIIKMGRWVIHEACRAIARFNLITKKPLQLSVNISTRQLQHDNLFDIIKLAIEENKISPEQLNIEITESVMLEKTEKIVQTLQRIKNLGVGICLDDFGTGYSSFTCLHNFSINTLKIDKSFVELIHKSNNKAALLDTIIAMGKTLNMKVVAEGVEKESQREYLMQKGCLLYQGYLFSKAVDERDYVRLL